MSSGSTETPRRVRVVEHYVIPTGAQAIQIRSATKATSMKGPVVEGLLRQVLDLLDGSRTEPQIVEALLASGEKNVRGLLKMLRERDFLEDVEEVDEAVFPEGSARQYDSMGRYFLVTDRSRTRTTSIGQLRRARVVLADLSPLTPGLLAQLGHLGVGSLVVAGSHPSIQLPATAKPGVRADTRALPTTVEGWCELLAGVDLAVVPSRQPAVFSAELDLVNRAALETGTSWLPLHLDRQGVLQLGPLVYPGESACLECLRQLFARNTSFLGTLGWFQDAAGPRPEPDLPQAAYQTAAALATVEISRALTTGQPPLSVATLLSFDLTTLAIDKHKVLKVPRCPQCGPARNRPPMRIWG